MPGCDQKRYQSTAERARCTCDEYAHSSPSLITYRSVGSIYIVKAKKRGRLSPAERRERILRAALQAFARGGYGGVSMNEIASAAGVTKPVLYDHFPSKVKIYVTVLESIRNELL